MAKRRREGKRRRRVLYRRLWALYPDIPKGSGHASGVGSIRGVVTMNCSTLIQASTIDILLDASHIQGLVNQTVDTRIVIIRSRKQSDFREVTNKRVIDEVNDSVA